jgi:AraC-like DNA-binding protein
MEEEGVKPTVKPMVKTTKPFVKYLTYSEEDESLGMVCTTAGYTEIKPGAPYPQNMLDHPEIFRTVTTGRILPDFYFIYIPHGEGVYETEGATYNVKPGSSILLLPMTRHRYTPLPDKGWNEYWVGFKGDFFSRLVHNGILSKKHTFLEIGFHSDMILTLEHIFNEVTVQKPLYQIRACSGIVSLIAELLTFERRQSQPNHYQKIVELAKFRIESNTAARREINIALIAAEVSVSVSRLNEIFKTYTSMTPYQYYLHLKINEAKILFENADISVKEAALNLGFDDQGHFSRLFKKKTGFAPSEWKKINFSGKL